MTLVYIFSVQQKTHTLSPLCLPFLLLACSKLIDRHRGLLLEEPMRHLCLRALGEGCLQSGL